MIRTLLALCLTMYASVTYAETIYKTIDDDGNVRYGAEPPPAGVNYEVLDKAPEPDEEDVKDSEERQKKLDNYLESTGESPQQPQQTQSGSVVEGVPDSAGAMEAWRERKIEERQRAFWGEDWPIHHPRHR